MTSDASSARAVAAITRRAADRLRAGHLWVYRSDLERLVPGSGDADRSPDGPGTLPPGALVTVPPGALVTVPSGALVTVVDGREIPLGTALYSAGSEIALRMVSRQAGLGREGYLHEVRERLRASLKLRGTLVPEAFSGRGDGEGATEVEGAAASQTDACRLVFSEADGLPGIIADRYSEIVVLQLLTQGTAQDDVRQVLLEVLAEQPWVGAIVERPDPRMRELEGLQPVPEGTLWSREGSGSGLDGRSPSEDRKAGPVAGGKPRTVFTINGVRFHFDTASGQKTGAFLDQRLNYAAAARVARGRALDVCTYQGGFALNLARVCGRVTGVDASRAALEVADQNLELNPGLTAQVDWVEADAFELLRDFADAGERFDTIVLDPPAFAKSKRAAEGAMRGYKELNLRALKMLNAGGTLVTCSCSHHIALDEFVDVVRAAAEDAGRSVQLLETRGAAPDHPAILTLPETSYLKCLICRLESGPL